MLIKLGKISKLLYCIFYIIFPLSHRKHFICSLKILQGFLLFKYWDLRNYRLGGIPIQSMESRKRMSFNRRQKIVFLLLLLFFLSCSHLTTNKIKSMLLFLVTFIIGQSLCPEGAAQSFQI